LVLVSLAITALHMLDETHFHANYRKLILVLLVLSVMSITTINCDNSPGSVDECKLLPGGLRLLSSASQVVSVLYWDQLWNPTLGIEYGLPLPFLVSTLIAVYYYH